MFRLAAISLRSLIQYFRHEVVQIDGEIWAAFSRMPCYTLPTACPHVPAGTTEPREKKCARPKARATIAEVGGLGGPQRMVFSALLVTTAGTLTRVMILSVSMRRSVLAVVG
jgi:hypothetical protein